MRTYDGTIHLSSELTYSRACMVMTIQHEQCLEITKDGRGITWTGKEVTRLEQALANVMALLGTYNITGVGVIKAYDDGVYAYDIVVLKNFVKVHFEGDLKTITPERF
jgi:hypothetical protein